jgi:hypothetical protein
MTSSIITSVDRVSPQRHREHGDENAKCKKFDAKREYEVGIALSHLNISAFFSVSSVSPW